MAKLSVSNLLSTKYRLAAWQSARLHVTRPVAQYALGHCICYVHVHLFMYIFDKNTIVFHFNNQLINVYIYVYFMVQPEISEMGGALQHRHGLG
jgi:hypothetical protein